eukprot:gene36133-43820_t
MEYIVILLLFLFVTYASGGVEPILLSVDDDLSAGFERAVNCRAFAPSKSLNADGTSSCWPSNNCKRKILDGLFTSEEVNKLIAIADKGVFLRPRVGGPTIVDINTGYIRDSAGLDNLFIKSNDIFDASDFLHYGNIIRRLKDTVMEAFNLETLYFTAPTFITRIDMDTPWNPKEIHDEYWHPHVDRNNTAHYQYSGLLYLSTFNEDFEGGRLLFYPQSTIADGQYQPVLPATGERAEAELVVEPKAGRVAMFSSGPENTHNLEKVTKGTRYVLSFWFTCDDAKKFEIFLDGKAHVAFSHKMRDSMRRKAAKGSRDL